MGTRGYGDAFLKQIGSHSGTQRHDEEFMFVMFVVPPNLPQPVLDWSSLRTVSSLRRERRQ